MTLRQMAVSAQRQADEKLKFRDRCLRRAEFLENKESDNVLPSIT
jgi:hypothetical protein